MRGDSRIPGLPPSLSVMAESDSEKTEAATPRRLEKAREQGQVARSRELNTFMMLAAGLSGLWLMGGHLAQVLMQIMRHCMGFGALGLGQASLANPSTAQPTRLLWQAGQFALQALFSLAGWFGLLAVTAIAASLALGGLVLSTQALQPKFERINPLKGLARLFSARSAVELLKTLAKVVVLGAVGAWVIQASLHEWLGLARAPLFEALAGGMRQVALACAALVATLLFVVMLDVPWQLWSHFKKLRMSREELKQEHKESEGDPQLKGRIRQMQRAAAKRRMMAAVPTADVIVTNPQHYAVALAYQARRWHAPRVVAKGSGLVAARIRALADEHRVPQLRVPPLARALHHHVDINQEIPAPLFEAVARVLAWAYQLRENPLLDAALAPKAQDIPIPPKWDPLESF